MVPASIDGVRADTSEAKRAEDGNRWMVTKISGTVWLLGDDAIKTKLKKSNTLIAGSAVHTERGARVLFTRGAETMRVGPNSKFSLPNREPEAGHTTIFQHAGKILYDVEKKNVKHFSVETPFLAAVVKGTRFTVAIGQNVTKVAVSRGRVEVKDNVNKKIVNVVRGQVASFSANGSERELQVSALDKNGSAEFGEGTPAEFDAASAASVGQDSNNSMISNADNVAGSASSTSRGQQEAISRSASTGLTLGWSFAAIFSNRMEIVVLVTGFSLLILHAAYSVFRKRNRRRIVR